MGYGEEDFGHNCSFDPASAFQFQRQNSNADQSRVLIDERELIKAAKLELKNVEKRQPLSRASKSQKAAQVLNTGDSDVNFAQRLGEVFKQTKGGFPSVEVEYNNLRIEADALVGAGMNPSVWNSFKSLGSKLLCLGGLETRPLTILDGVSGVLKPGKLTLLIGPPGSGKSVLMQALSGRLHLHKGLRQEGSIKYNGEDVHSFVVQRTAGLVDQYDQHIPNLTVAETVKFAGDCQIGRESRIETLVAVNKAAVEAREQVTKEALEASSSAANLVNLAEEGKNVNAEELFNSARGGLARDGNASDDGASTSSTVLTDGTTTTNTTASSCDAHAKAEFIELFRDAVLYQLKPYVTLHLLGLSHVADTFVGNETLRGVSGGERKRVTSAEVLVGPQWALFMDEISTGLDSATTYTVTKSLRDTCHALNRTIVISLLQPAPEVINLFDDLLLLTDGKVIYHGPMGEAIPFFKTLGFECPSRKDPASFLQEVTTPLGQLTYASEKLLDEYNVPAVLRDPAQLLVQPPKQLLISVDKISEAFWNSSHGIGMRTQLDKEPFKPESGNPAALARTHFANSGMNLAMLALRRQMILIVREKAYYIARLIQALVMGLIISSLFATIGPPSASDPNYQSDVFNEGRKAISLCVLSCIYMSLSSMPVMGFTFGTKRIFYKQRDNHFFPSWSYVISLLLSQVPPSTAESILFSLVLYWISGLTRTASNFFIYWLVVWSASNCLAGMFRLIAYFTPSMVVGNATAGIITLLLTITNASLQQNYFKKCPPGVNFFILFFTDANFIYVSFLLMQGFSIIRTSIPPYLIWIYYGLNPLSYSINALAINELTSPRWGEAGPAVLEQFAIWTDKKWIWIGVGFAWGYLLLITGLGAVALLITNPPGPKASIPLQEQKLEVERELSSYIRRRQGTSLSLDAAPSNLIMGTSTSTTFDGAVGAGAGAAAGAGPAVSRKNSSKTYGPMDSAASVESGVFQISTAEAPMLSPSPSATSTGAMSVPFVPITLVCRNICYYVDDPSGGSAPGVVKNTEDKEVSGKLQLLKSIDFYARPGELVALMGGSGAGKTTLLDVVAGRKTQGLIRGEILVNGRPKVQGIWSRVVGYVEQMDIHSSRITVKESLQFSARLRLEEATVSDAQVAAIVKQTLETVELGSLAGNIVGEPGGEGLSIEQRKRLSIAVELVANPSVLFMDEPTSGLDARSAAIVMRAVRNVANGNRTVMVTIHQPSMEIFEAFDQLVLMQRGGRLTYFGPLGIESSSLIKYLESYEGVQPIKASYNPATWMLESTGGSMATTFKAADIDFPEAYLESELRASNLKLMDEFVAASAANSPELAVGGQYATSFQIQVRELLRKYFLYYWRASNYNFIRIIMTLCISLIYGLTYLNEAKAIRPGSPPASVNTVQNIMGLIFSMSIFNGMFNAMTVLPLISAERVVFYRESAASMYAPRALALAQGVAELPYLAVQAIVMVTVSYFMVGFELVAWKFFYFLLMFFLTITMYTFLGQFLVVATPNQLLAQLIAAFLNSIWTIFNGFLVPYPQTPAGWQWLSRCSPTTWILYGMGGSQMADSQVELEGYEGASTIADFVNVYFGYEYGFIWWCPLIVLAYVIFFRTMSALLMSYVSFNKR
jgi:ABC-type multidrug transport system ATPase subunit/ABC-type multidrug transport system permease subunit